MFQSFKYSMKNLKRGTIKSIVAAFLFGAIIVVFIFWGMDPRNQTVAQGSAVAEVNGTLISIAQYNDAMERMRRDPRFEQLQALGGDAGRQILQSQAVSQLVEFEVLRQEADKQKLWTTDAEVRDLILAVPAFQENGQFRRDYYMAQLQAMRKTPAEFENEVRSQQSLSRAVRLFNSALRPLPIEAEKVGALSNLRANLEYVSVPMESLVAPDAIKEDEVKAFLADASNAAKVKEYFDTHKAEFSTPEQVKVRHILVRAQAGDAEAETKALAKIEAAAKRAQKEDFSKLAKELSEDPGSKANGGLIDFFSRGKMVPEFEDAAFSAPANSITQPIKTQYGYHLIQVLEKKPAQDRGLEGVRNEIAALLVAKDKSSKAVASLQEVLKGGDEVAVRKFVADYKLKWDETGAFGITSDSVPKIGGQDDVLKAAFTLTPAQPLAKSLFRQGSTGYIVRYKAAPAEVKDKNSPKPDALAEMTASRRSDDAVRMWSEMARKNSKIVINEGAMSGRGGMAEPPPFIQ